MFSRQAAARKASESEQTLHSVARASGGCPHHGALGQAAAQLERLGRAQDLAGATRMWGLVDELFAKTLTEMKGLVAE